MSEINRPEFVLWQKQCKCDLHWYQFHSRTCTERFENISKDNQLTEGGNGNEP